MASSNEGMVDAQQRTFVITATNYSYLLQRTRQMQELPDLVIGNS